MVRIICGSCKNEAFLVPYFYDHYISKEVMPMSQTEVYKAYVKAHVVCPICGTTMYKTYTTILDSKDIEKIVLEKNRQC